MSLSTENRTGTLRWSKGAARLSYDSPKAPSRRPQGTLKDPWRYVEHRAAAVRAPYVSLAMLNFPGRPSHGDCEYHPFGYKYRDSRGGFRICQWGGGGGSKISTFSWPKFIRNTYRKSYMTYQFIEITLTLFSNTEVLPNFIALCSFLGWKYGPLWTIFGQISQKGCLYD